MSKFCLSVYCAASKAGRHDAMSPLPGSRLLHQPYTSMLRHICPIVYLRYPHSCSLLLALGTVPSFRSKTCPRQPYSRRRQHAIRALPRFQFTAPAPHQGPETVITCDLPQSPLLQAAARHKRVAAFYSTERATIARAADAN